MQGTWSTFMELSMTALRREIHSTCARIKDSGAGGSGFRGLGFGSLGFGVSGLF